ncbi:collectin-11 [Plakobranchus ocellatus]|uniref:Collectin-11 n=1 Tax=Plakobranchus ocellatus TaxID=259542 RepID=A0AAV4CBL2_9GAST|nr:collectin-11 [Plakobranchus ocellatus]
MRTVKSLTILRSETVKEENYKAIATVTPNSKTSNLGDSELTVAGKITQGGESTVLAEYVAPNSGYCFFYKCVAEGTDKKGRFGTYNRKRRDRCDKKRRNLSADVAEKSKNGTEGTKSKVETNVDIPTKASSSSASKLDSIDKTKFDVSTVFNGAFYILSKNDDDFNIERDAMKCKDNGGYLLEIDTVDEFVHAIRFQYNSLRPQFKNVYTGLNDRMTEGTFVQYHSKRPMGPEHVWSSGQPDNAGDGEDCVIMAENGLWDISCSLKGRFMCEIPLR